MRIRLLAGLAVAAALLGLTACRSSPEVAAYVGATTITEDQVTRLISDYVAKQETAAREQAEAEAEVPPVQPPGRGFVVQLLVRAEICERLKGKLGFQAEAPTLPHGAPELFAISERSKACFMALPSPASIDPTEVDVREVFDAGVRVGVFEPGSLEEHRAQILSGGQLAQALGQRKLIKDTLGDTDITVNPRYGTVELALLSWQQGSALALTFGQTGPVVDAPRPEPSATPAQ